MGALRVVAVLPLLLLFSGCTAVDAECRATVRDEHGEWRREGVVFADPQIANVEVIPVDDGYRMAIHHGPNIESAFSRDGRTFTIEAGVRLEGQMPAFVALDGGGWRMYFKRGFGADTAIRSALTADGYNFTVEHGTRIARGGPGEPDADDVVHPTVVRLPGGGFRMYYDGQTGSPMDGGEFHWTLLSARSDDGLVWTKEPGERIPTGRAGCFEMVWSAHAEIDDGLTVLYFSAETDPFSMGGIYRATSADGLNFTVEPAPMLKYGKNDDPEGGGIHVPQDPFILHADGLDRMFYWTQRDGLLSAVREP